MGPSYLLWISRIGPERKSYRFSHINPLLVKLVRSRWLNIGLVLFMHFTELDFVSVNKKAKKKLAKLTSRLVNNAFINL